MNRKSPHFSDSEKCAKLIINQLVQQGVRFFSIAPGSRSTPFAIAIAEHPDTTSVVHFDERGAGFQALGYAKATGKPAAVLVTSGTAVANLFPAVMEASLAQIPLVLLTADRPTELRDIGSNQTADQVKIFGGYVRWQIDLPCADPQVGDAFVARAVAHAVFRAEHAPKGPVQINCMVREPSFGTSSTPFPEAVSVCYEEAEPHPSEEMLDEWVALLSSCKRGAVIVGGNLSERDPAPIHALAEKLGWPLFADLLSGARVNSAASIPYYDLLIKTGRASPIDTVLHFGDRVTSKALQEWITPSHYLLVARHPVCHDPKHQVTRRVVCDPVLFAQSLLPRISKKTGDLQVWQAQAEEIKAQLEIPELSEPSVAYHLARHLPKEFALFLANSMPIRDADTFFFSENKTKIFSNRGVSGIDGNIATVAGIAHGLQRPVLAIVGDQTFLHDLNSLPLLKKTPCPVVLLVINNGGGAIFSFLPISEKKEVFEDFFAAKHAMTFEKAAELFEMPYMRVESEEELQRALSTKRSMLLEMRTERKANFDLHQKIIQQCLSTQFAAR